MPQVFLSYASGNAYFSELLRMKLIEAGIRVWRDHDDLHVGEKWRNAIDEGISSSDVLIVVITPESCKSAYVTYEWAFAIGKGIKVIPLLLTDSEIHPKLDEIQYIDFRDQKNSPWNKLIDEISNTAPNSNSNDTGGYVKDMTVDQLQEMISSVVSLSIATEQSSGHKAEAGDISRAAKSVVDLMKHTKHAEKRSTEILEKRILWVDDRPNNNIYERQAFESMGFTFKLALSTNEALDILSQDKFVAIISDMGRREGPREGYVLLDEIRNRGDNTPFFIYAGSNALKHKREAKQHGAQGSTNHPQELFELVSRSLL